MPWDLLVFLGLVFLHAVALVTVASTRRPSSIFATILLLFGYLCVIGILAKPVEAGTEKDTERISVTVDGLPVAFDAQPIIQNGRILVPLRAIAEALSIMVTWDGATQTVYATDGKTSVRLQTGNKIAYCNENPISLDVPPLIVNGRTLIPLRFFSEAFNCKVMWSDSENSVRIMSPPKKMTVIGFYALGDSKTSSWTNLFGKPYPETFSGNTDVVGELALGWYSLDKNGNLLTRSRTGWQRPDGWEKVLEAAQKYNLKTEMVIHVTDGDGTISSLLSDEVAMTRAARAIAEEAAKLYQGVNLDFEGLGYQESEEQLKVVQDRFTNFVKLLANQLKPLNLNLTLTLHAPNSVYKGYDYKALGEIADRIILMAYDYGSQPEPASLVIEAVEMAKTFVPPEKLVLGISVPAETPDSLLTKVGIAKRYNLSGIALWRLGLVTGEMWNVLRSNVLPKKNNSTKILAAKEGDLSKTEEAIRVVKEYSLKKWMATRYKERYVQVKKAPGERLYHTYNIGWEEVVTKRVMDCYKRWQAYMKEKVDDPVKLTRQFLRDTEIPFLQEMAEAATYFLNGGYTWHDYYAGFEVLGVDRAGPSVEVTVREIVVHQSIEGRGALCWADQVYTVVWEVGPNGKYGAFIDKQKANVSTVCIKQWLGEIPCEIQEIVETPSFS